MSTTRRTEEGEVLSNLILDLFKVNNLIITSGDKLVSSIGLTSARWQVLGTIAKSDEAIPIVQIAQRMGTTRQNIQRIVRDLIKMHLLTPIANPKNKRASFIVLTDEGKEKFNQAMNLQIPWVNKLASGMKLSDIQATFRVLVYLSENLEKVHRFKARRYLADLDGH